MAMTSHNDHGRNPAAGRLLRTGLEAAVRLALLAGLWWVIVEGRPGSWWVGGPVVVIAAVTSLTVYPASWLRISPIGVLMFLPRFVTRSVAGGVDVAWRAFSPSMPLDPGVMTRPHGLPDGPARVLFALTLSLQPGTVAGAMTNRGLEVHVLDRTMHGGVDLDRTERDTGRVFAVTVDPGTAETRS